MFGSGAPPLKLPRSCLLTGSHHRNLLLSLFSQRLSLLLKASHEGEGILRDQFPGLDVQDHVVHPAREILGLVRQSCFDLNSTLDSEDALLAEMLEFLSDLHLSVGPMRTYGDQILQNTDLDSPGSLLFHLILDARWTVLSGLSLLKPRMSSVVAATVFPRESLVRQNLQELMELCHTRYEEFKFEETLGGGNPAHVKSSIQLFLNQSPFGCTCVQVIESNAVYLCTALERY